MQVLLIGGTRFIGLEISWSLLLAGHDLTILANEPLPPVLANHARLISGDRTQPDQMQALLGSERFDAVIDNIGYTPPALAAVLDALVGRVGRYLYTSTSNVYPWNFPRTWREEEAPLTPGSSHHPPPADEYAANKRACELYLRRQSVPWTVLRPSIVSGRADNVRIPPARLLERGENGSRSLFLPCRVLDRGPILLREDDESIFQLLWARDLGQAYAVILAHEESRWQAYNIAGPEVWNPMRVIRKLAEVAGVEAEIVYVPARFLQELNLEEYCWPPWGQGRYWASFETHKLEALGWKPTDATVWFKTLVESMPPPHERPRNATRLKEIALARALQQRLYSSHFRS